MNDDVLDATLEALRDVLQDEQRPVATAVEVADRLDVSRPTATSRLQQLAARDDVGTDKVGRTRIWWPSPVVTPAKAPEQPPGGPAEGEVSPAKTSAEPPAEPPAETEECREQMENALDDVDVPGRKAAVEQTRREAIRFAWEFLADRGRAESSELANATFGKFFDDDHLGYSTSSRYPGYQMWDGTVRDALKQLPGVEPPAERGSTWRFDEKQ